MNEEQKKINETGKCHIQKLRGYMKSAGLDAFIVRKNANLRWLTAAPHVFDDDPCHTAYITADEAHFRTDGRYFETFVERLSDETFWDLYLLDQSNSDDTDAKWLVKHMQKAGSQKVGIEDSVTVEFLDALEGELLSQKSNVALVHEHQAVDDLRISKDADELALLQAAQDVTDDALDFIVSYIKPGMTEKEASQALDNYMLMHGGEALSFSTIFASGPNGALPHAQPGSRKIQKGDLIVIDFGTTVGEYHSDMTRMVSVGEPSEKQKQVYDIVRRAHETAAGAVKPDVLGIDIHNIAAQVIADAGYGEYFTHGLGHGVGIEEHENPGFRPSWDKPVPEGSVVSIEPGIYVPQEFGIRLEDTGVVTKEGFKPFTRYNHDLIVINAD